jgi:hypothetical protein
MKQQRLPTPAGTDPLDENDVPADNDGDNISNVTDTDDDNDGLTDTDEATLGTSPTDSDTDNDGQNDNAEVTTNGGTVSSPADTDSDGTIDALESSTTDTDSDGVVDELDVDNTDPNSDSDGDGYTDLDETTAGTDPLDENDVPFDLDGDGVDDATESAAPNGGDFNSDGIADRDQANVTTKKNEVTGEYTSIISDNTNCGAINKFAFLNESNLATKDSDYDYALGLHNFVINCSEPGQSTKVTIIWDKEYDTSTWVYRKYNSITKEYKDISSLVSYGTNTIGDKKYTTSSYHGSGWRTI